MRNHEPPYVRINHHPDFEVVVRGEEDIFIIADGHRSGTVFTDPEDYEHMIDGHIFIRTKDEEVLQRLVSMEEDLKRIGDYYSRVRHCHLVDVIDAYTRRYGRPNVLDV